MNNAKILSLADEVKNKRSESKLPVSKQHIKRIGFPVLNQYAIECLLRIFNPINVKKALPKYCCHV